MNGQNGLSICLFYCPSIWDLEIVFNFLVAVNSQVELSSGTIREGD